MDHEFTPEQELFRATVREFCEKEITREYVRECDRERRPPRDLYDKLGDQGWLGINIPEEHGGAGAGAVEVAILLEELGRAFLDLSFWVFRAVTWGGLAISRDGTPEQKTELLPRVASGELTVCFSLTEPDAGSDAAAISLSAVEDGDDYVLNGQKVFTSGFKASDLDVVATRTSSDGKKHHGITNFIVDTASPGLEWQPIETLGHWPLGTAMLYFTDVRVPKSRMLGTLHEGWADLGVYLRYERLCLSAARTGAAAAALADSVAYAKEREQFGRPWWRSPRCWCTAMPRGSTVAWPRPGTRPSSSSTPARPTSKWPTWDCRSSAATGTPWSTTCSVISASRGSA
jgi:alkylation response protein AidB-like acyl-CoA dehydrogenase